MRGNTAKVPAPPLRPQPRGKPRPPLSSPPRLHAARRRGSARAPATLRQKRPSDSARARMRSCRVSPRAAHARTVCTRPLKPAASWCPPASSSVGCQPRTCRGRRPPPSPRPAPPRDTSVMQAFLAGQLPLYAIQDAGVFLSARSGRGLGRAAVGRYGRKRMGGASGRRGPASRRPFSGARARWACGRARASKVSVGALVER
jgi:hypothetical protein